LDININLLETSIEQYNEMVVPKIPIFMGQDLECNVLFFNPGQATKTQKHKNDEKIIIVLKGDGRIKIDEEEFDVSTGSTVYIKKGQNHQITNGKKNRMTIAQITKINPEVTYQHNTIKKVDMES
jgi:mannose-6-phosphate isomerase-like protein (cupin superfamily)